MANDPTRSTRVSTELPVWFKAGDAFGEGRIRDISRTGARIEYSRSVKTKPVAGSDVMLGVVITGAHQQIEATVVRVTETGFGVAFVGLGPNGREVLDAFLQPRDGRYKR